MFIIVLALLANERNALICCRKETVISKETPNGRTEKLNRAKRPTQTSRFNEIGYLSRDVAHDLNSLLSGIATYPEVLLMDNDLDKTIRDGLMIIRDAGQKAATIVSDFLMVSTGITAEKTPIDLNYLLDEFFKTPEFKMLKTTFPAISITAQQEPELLCINASYAHMEKTVNYLLWFACSHLDVAGQGQVIVATSNIYFHQKTANEKSISPGEYILLQIHIVGNGLERDHSDHLFEPFYTRNVMKKEGSGLEMVIVWHTIQNHKGMIHWTTGPADICFDLYIPALESL
jgi:nitrogen-specific signal transduction histidine kinase